MKNFLLVIFLISLCLSVTAQSSDNEVDSLITSLSFPLDDTTRMNTWQKLGDLLYNVDTTKCLLFADSLLEMAITQDRVDKKGEAYRIKANVNYVKGDYETTRELISLGIPCFLKVDNKERLGKLYNLKGISYHLEAKTSEALENYLNAMPYFEAMEMDQAISRNLNNIGIIYRSTYKYDKALEIYNSSLAIKRKLNDSLGMANVYFNIGLAHGFLKNDKEAVDNLEIARQLFKNLKSESDVASVDLALGIKQIESNRFEDGINILERSLAERRQLFSTSQVLTAYKFLGKALIQLENFDKAILYLDEGYEMVKETTSTGLQYEFNTLMSKAYAGQNRFREAYLFLEVSKELNDTLYQTSKVEAQEEMETRFETKLKENTIALQDVQIAQQKERSRLYLIIASLLGLTVLAFGVLGYFLRKSRKELADKNKIISKSLDEKEMLLKEIHHRVKNNLQVISSLLSLQSQTITDETAYSAILEGRNRVKSMALIHQNLYQDENLSGVNAAEYIAKLTENLFSSYRVDHDNIKFQHQVAPVSLDVDTIIPIGLILNELISNALKYAFPDGRKGILEVQLEQLDEGIKLSVKDNGVGVGKGTLDKKQSTSMGYRIVNAFVKKLKAVMTVDHQEGTKIDILIPV